MDNPVKRIALSALVLFLIYSLSKTVLDYQKKLEFADVYRKDYEAEKHKNKQLKSELIKSQDQATVERNIRERLNLTKPGEVVVLLPKPSLTPTPTPHEVIPAYQQWLKLFLL